MNLDLYIDTARRQVVSGPDSSALVELPVFSQGNIVTLRIRCLVPTANFPFSNPPYEVLPTTGRTLQVAVGTKSGSSSTHYTEQYTWALSADLADPYFFADLAFNTGAIGTLLGSTASKTAYLEVNLVEGGTPRTILSKLITIEASVIKNDTLTVPSGLTPLSAEAAAAEFLQREITGPITLVCATDPTKKVSVYVDTDGTFHTDEIT